MSIFFCGKCGISAGTQDVFCHRCGMEMNVQTAPITEYAASQMKICPQCGEYVPLGDRFCVNCGSGLLTPGFNTQIHTKKRLAPSGVTTHRRRRSFLFKLVSALVFWSVAIGSLYALYNFLGRDIPWSDVVALVTGSESRTGGAHVTESGYARYGGLPPIVPETGNYDGFPPIVPETSGSGGLTNTPHTPEEPVPSLRPEWGSQDANGYSVLTLPGQDGAGRDGGSLRGVVNGGRVRLRAEPNTESEVLGQFDSGKEFEVTRRFRAAGAGIYWYRVSSGADEGWMYGEYLRIAEE